MIKNLTFGIGNIKIGYIEVFNYHGPLKFDTMRDHTVIYKFKEMR